MKILILSPHPDDCELSMGGTIQTLIADGHELKVLFFSDCNIIGVRAEITASMDVLGVKRWYLLNYPRRTMDNNRHEIRQVLCDEKNVSRVYCPSPFDVHQDHATIANEAIRAFNCRAEIMHYIWPKNMTRQLPSVYNEITSEQLDKKVAALMCYKSQVKLRSWYFNEEAIRSATVTYGTMFGVRYAEAFEPFKIKH